MLFLSAIFALFMAELTFRFFNDYIVDYRFGLVRSLRFNELELDPDIGYRPVLGGVSYSEAGTRTNEYDIGKKREGAQRLLFLGDSVVKRERITQSLRQLYGEEKFEYWNAGIEGINTLQEVQQYISHNHIIDPDQVVLFFHNNDFSYIPVVFLDSKDEIVFYRLPFIHKVRHKWLFRNVFLYRFLVMRYPEVMLKDEEREFLPKMENNVAEQLALLKNVLESDGIPLTVVILPIVDDFENWQVFENENHAEIKRILTELNIRNIDLREALEQPNPFTGKVRQYSTQFDRWHPDGELAEYLARYLYDRDLLGIKEIEQNKRK